MVELDNMKSEIQTYQIPLQEVSASLDLENKEKRIEELEMEMQSPNFWDDPEISNKKMKRMRQTQLHFFCSFLLQTKLVIKQETKRFNCKI